MKSLEAALAKFPRARLTHTPTPLHKLERLSAELSSQFCPCDIYVKRDDCTGLALGGNKSRHLEFYLGEAIANGCDTVLSTGAVQSNHLRMLAAAAAKFGLECHLQLEDRVPNRTDEYCHSGNVLLARILGATLHKGTTGDDEARAHDSLLALADQCTEQGKKPYIIPLGTDNATLGALGYVVAAMEFARQIEQTHAPIDLLVIGSGSGLSHAGVLTGLRWMGMSTAVLGVCVRRAATLQHPRVLRYCQNIADMLGRPGIVEADDVWVDDSALAPGYGYASAQVKSDMRLLAKREGLLVDPVYSGKTFSGLLDLMRRDGTMVGTGFRHIAMIHTGGTPGLFAYSAEVLV